jgi:hypothetical protein
LVLPGRVYSRKREKAYLTGSGALLSVNFQMLEILVRVGDAIVTIAIRRF